VTGGNANLVAFNNLYVNDGRHGYMQWHRSDVLFAYNITTAPAAELTLPRFCPWMERRSPSWKAFLEAWIRHFPCLDVARG